MSSGLSWLGRKDYRFGDVKFELQTWREKICIMGSVGSTYCYPNNCQPALDTLAQTLMEKNTEITRLYLYSISRLEAIWLADYIGTISNASVIIPTETE